MTCIIGLLDKKKIYMMGDSAGVGGQDVSIRKDPKVFKIGKMLMGFTGSFRFGQLLRFSLKLPPNKRKDDYEYMVRDVVEAMRNCLKKGGYTRISDNRESAGIILVGYKKRLYCIQSDFQVEEVYDNYDAVGCGRNYALGSLHSTQSIKYPEARLRLAMESAVKYSTGVRPPSNLLTL